MITKRNVPGYLEAIEYSGGRVGVLLFHSLGGTPLEMKYIAKHLAREGHTVRCPIIPGMTNGTDVLKLSNWQDWAEAAESTLDEMRETCDTVFIGGLSAGSMLALRLAERRPEDIGGHIVMSPTLWPNGWTIPWYFNFFRIVWQNWFASLFTFEQRAPYGIKDERLRKFMIEAFQSGGRSMAQVYARHGRMVMQFRMLADSVKRRLGTLTKPTIVLHPREDDQSHMSNALKVIRLLGGPVEAHILDDCYHMISFDRQRDEVAERVSTFVARHATAMGLMEDDVVPAAVTAEPAEPSEDQHSVKAVAAE